MPCLNEAETLTSCIRKAKHFLTEEKVDGEIVIADNGSTDGSIQIALDCNARVVNVSEKGYGSALSGGIQQAGGKYIIMGDADDSYDFNSLKSFLVNLREGDDLVMGNRFKGGIQKGAMPFLHRYLGNPVLSFIGRIFFRIKIGDFHCGLRGFSADAFAQMNLKTTGMEFASEMVVKAALLGMKISEVPTVLSQDGRSRPPHLRTWRDGWRHLRFLLLFSPRWLFLIPGLVLLSLALIGGTMIYAGPVRVNRITLDVHTLIYLAFILLISIQLIFFHLFVRVYSVTSGILPETRQYRNTFKYFTLERGLIFGAALLTMGLVMVIRNIYFWGLNNFGQLDPHHFIRQVVAATALSALGAQLVIYSFIFSILGIKK